MDEQLFSIFFFFPIIGGLMIFFYYQRRAKEESESLFNGTLQSPLGRVLENVPYFRKLSEHGKLRFATRVAEIMESWSFYGREDLTVTQSMEIFICATAAQLTFGLEDKLEDHFTQVQLYPEPFYVRQLDAELRGAASPQGVLYLSWSNFAEGISDPYDGVNLGLHEMAHALMITARTEGHRSLLKSFTKWMRFSLSVIDDPELKYSGVLRNYAFTNKEEFFAVCVEHFFEEPEDLRLHLPQLYENLCDLLNQDPLNYDNDYRVEISAWKPQGLGAL